MPAQFKRVTNRFGTQLRRVQKVEVVKPKRKKRGPKIQQLLQNKVTTKLKYVDLVTVDPGIAGIATHTFRANDTFDPDYSGTGHQPLAYDTYTTLYAKKRVLSSKITITPVHMDISDATPCMYGVFNDSDTSISYGNGLELIEDLRIKGKWGIAGATDFMLVNQSHMKRRASFNVKQMGPEQRDNTSVVGASPDALDSRYYQVWASGITAADNPSAQDFVVEIEYTVEFTQPIHLAQS